MTDGPLTPALQFQRAEYADAAPATLVCHTCQVIVSDSYFEVNGEVTCGMCREQIAQAQKQSGGAKAALLAVVGGVGAGVVGALIYYAVAALSGYEVGLIAVVVGYLVGRAVFLGSGSRGGRGYQLLAVAITYIAIVSTYVPFIIQGMRESARTEVNASAAAPAETRAPMPDGGRKAPPTTGEFVFALAVLSAFVLASPFLAGIQNIIGWLIIGFALFEAWKINRRIEVEVTGPFTLPSTAPSTPA